MRVSYFTSNRFLDKMPQTPPALDAVHDVVQTSELPCTPPRRATSSATPLEDSPQTPRQSSASADRSYVDVKETPRKAHTAPPQTTTQQPDIPQSDGSHIQGHTQPPPQGTPVSLKAAVRGVDHKTAGFFDLVLKEMDEYAVLVDVSYFLDTYVTGKDFERGHETPKIQQELKKGIEDAKSEPGMYAPLVSQSPFAESHI